LLPDTDGIAGCPIKNTKKKIQKNRYRVSSNARKKKRTHSEERTNFRRKTEEGLCTSLALTSWRNGKYMLDFCSSSKLNLLSLATISNFPSPAPLPLFQNTAAAAAAAAAKNSPEQEHLLLGLGTIQARGAKQERKKES
jgi:hypothetical protein